MYFSDHVITQLLNNASLFKGALCRFEKIFIINISLRLLSSVMGLFVLFDCLIFYIGPL